MENARQTGFDEKYDAVVVGAGLGGLTCGALLAREGLKVLIVERHERPGGFSTSFKRNGFDFQVPNLAFGCAPGGTARTVMEYLGVDIGFKPVEPFHRYVYPEHDVIFGSGLDSFSERLKEEFVPRAADIKSFFQIIDKVRARFDPRILRGPFSFGKMFGAAKVASHLYLGKTYQEALDRHFDDDRLKAILSTSWPCAGAPPWEVSAMAMMLHLSRAAEGAFLPEGGFCALADALTDAYLGFGGSMLLGHEVTSINIENGRASGVETHPRSKVASPVVISDGDSRRTFIKLVDRENFTHTFLDKIDAHPPSVSGLCVHLGIEGRLDRGGIGPGTLFYQPSYDTAAMFDSVSGKVEFPHPGSFAWMLSVHSLTDGSLAPPGCSCLSVTAPGVPNAFMKRWGVESGGVRGDRYQEIKERYAECVVQSVHQAFPGLIKDVRAYDVATPVTYERYTMALDGCWSDSAQVPRQTLLFRPGPTTSVKGLYITGSKSSMGPGIGPAMVSGLLAADSVLKGKLKDLF